MQLLTNKTNNLCYHVSFSIIILLKKKKKNFKKSFFRKLENCFFANSMKKRRYFFYRNFVAFIFLLSANFLFSQTTHLKGKIVEVETGDPVSFANIVILKTTLGGISDENGKFEISYPDSLSSHTLLISAIGYKLFTQKLSNLKSPLTVNLEDSLFLIDEVKALAYDFVKPLKWENKKKHTTQYLLTFATRDKNNATNFIKIFKELFHKNKQKNNVYFWKKIKLPNINEKASVTVIFSDCEYCPLENDINITLAFTGKKTKNLLSNEKYRKVLTAYFQSLLDKTFAQGINFSQLEKRNGTYYLVKGETPYTGKCYQYFKSGQKGLKGQIVNGKRNGQWDYWYSDGQQKLSVQYKNGKKSGDWLFWYPSGQMKSKTHFVDGKLEGINYWWYENGQMKKEALFENGVFKKKREWDEKGRLIEDYFNYKIKIKNKKD